MYGGFFSLKSLSRNVNIFIPLILFEICFREPIIFFAFPAFCLGGILKCAVELCQRVGGTKKWPFLLVSPPSLALVALACIFYTVAMFSLKEFPEFSQLRRRRGFHPFFHRPSKKDFISKNGILLPSDKRIFFSSFS